MKCCRQFLKFPVKIIRGIRKRTLFCAKYRTECLLQTKVNKDKFWRSFIVKDKRCILSFVFLVLCVLSVYVRVWINSSFLKLEPVILKGNVDGGKSSWWRRVASIETRRTTTTAAKGRWSSTSGASRREGEREYLRTGERERMGEREKRLPGDLEREKRLTGDLERETSDWRSWTWETSNRRSWTWKSTNRRSGTKLFASVSVAWEKSLRLLIGERNDWMNDVGWAPATIATKGACNGLHHGEVRAHDYSRRVFYKLRVRG